MVPKSNHPILPGMRNHSNLRPHRSAGARLLQVLCTLLAIPLHATADPSHLEFRLASWWQPELLTLEKRLAAIQSERAALPKMPDMDARGTHGFHSDFTLDSESNWFQIDWEQAREIDALAFIPTRLTTQSGDMSNYGLPHRLRIEAGLAGNPEHAATLAEIPDTILAKRRGEPIFLKLPPTRVHWIRIIPIDLPTFPGKEVRFFSLAETLVFDGGQNIAPQGTLSANFSIDAETGWNLRYLTDGLSPLGPPELPEPSNSLGWHADIAFTKQSIAWAEIDLGSLQSIDQVRLVAAKGDSPVKGPGFGFPVRFEILTSPAESGDDSWTRAWDSGPHPFPNPGYNLLSFPIPTVLARRVRLSVTEQHQPDILTAPRILLSEIEVLEGNTNHALGKPVLTPDAQASRPHDNRRVWSAQGLTDGHSSTGRLIPLRPWIEQLAKRFDLDVEHRILLSRRDAILSRTRATALTTAFASLGTVILGLILWQIRLRLSARTHILKLRQSISSDLHDEVGSNLATISLLADLSAQASQTHPAAADISRLARESSLSLREIIDITLAHGRTRKPLPERLREIADVMLRGLQWSFHNPQPFELDLEKRRNLVFFFKEALHNIVRHAHASTVTLRFEAHGPTATLLIADDGVGLPQTHNETPRLHTLEQRAHALGGTLNIHSTPQAGTTLTLQFPLRQRPSKP